VEKARKQALASGRIVGEVRVAPLSGIGSAHERAEHERPQPGVHATVDGHREEKVFVRKGVGAFITHIAHIAHLRLLPSSRSLRHPNCVLCRHKITKTLFTK
jgi:hypothetical protein